MYFYLLALSLLAATNAVHEIKKASISEHPYHVTIERGTYFACNAAIINKHWVLAPYQCLNFGSPGDYTVRAGTNTKKNGGSVHQVSEIIKHSEFKTGKSYVEENDVALVRVKQAFVFDLNRQPISLFNKGEKIAAGRTAEVTGFGFHSEPSNQEPAKAYDDDDAYIVRLSKIRQRIEQNVPKVVPKVPEKPEILQSARVTVMNHKLCCETLQAHRAATPENRNSDDDDWDLDLLDSGSSIKKQGKKPAVPCHRETLFSRLLDSEDPPEAMEPCPSCEVPKGLIRVGYREVDLDKDLCYGDYGSPLVVDGKLAGVSLEEQCYNGIDNYPKLYLDVAYYREWIDRQIWLARWRRLLLTFAPELVLLVYLMYLMKLRLN